MPEDEGSLEITQEVGSHSRPFLTRRVQSAVAKVSQSWWWKLSQLRNVAQRFHTYLLFSGHFTKDCFSAPGLQYALLPEEDDEGQQQQQQQTSAVKQQQDSAKKHKKKKVKYNEIQLFHFYALLSSPGI